MSVNTRFYHLNASWENLLACCGMHLLRQNEGGEEERHWPRPRLSDLLASPSFRSCHRKPKHEPRGGPHPPRPEAGDGRSASDCAVTGASTRGSRSDPKRSGKQLLPVCFKKNAEHLLPMVFCDACGHGGGAGQVFTLSPPWPLSGDASRSRCWRRRWPQAGHPGLAPRTPRRGWQRPRR